jgi:hypothetical protein
VRSHIDESRAGSTPAQLNSLRYGKSPIIPFDYLVGSAHDALLGVFRKVVGSRVAGRQSPRYLRVRRILRATPDLFIFGSRFMAGAPFKWRGDAPEGIWFRTSFAAGGSTYALGGLDGRAP